MAGAEAAEPSVDIRHVERFPEPDFSRLNRQVFADVQQPSTDLAAALAAEMPDGAPQAHAHIPMYRLGAYVGDDLVGWTCGWMERGQVFYVANSGVLAAHRRKGIYTALMSAMHAYAQAQGAVAVRSQHSVLNNPILIAKLRAGYHVSGLSQSAQMGTLVELTRYFFPERQSLLRARALPYVMPDNPPA